MMVDIYSAAQRNMSVQHAPLTQHTRLNDIFGWTTDCHVNLNKLEVNREISSVECEVRIESYEVVWKHRFICVRFCICDTYSQITAKPDYKHSFSESVAQTYRRSKVSGP